MTEAAALAIEGGAPVRSAPWPDAPSVAPADDAHPIEALEAAIADVLGLPPWAVIAYADAAEAYRVALGRPASGDGRDEIVIPCLLEEAAIEAARTQGWRIVPGEVEADTATLAARGLARAISERTAVAVVGHAFGHPATMADVTRLAHQAGVVVIEDITGALGSSFRDAPAGRMGEAAVLAGRPGDPISRGAYVVFPDEAAAGHIRGQRLAPPSEADARVALSEVRCLDEELTRRRQLAWDLTFAVRGMRGLGGMAHGRWIRHAYARYVVRLRGMVWKRPLADTLEALRAEGVPCDAASGPSLHRDRTLLEAFPDDPRFSEDVFPVAARLPDELIAIPLHSGLTSKDMDQVAAALRKLEAASI